MARAKPSPLAAVRKQVASEQKLKHNALLGSGYHNLQTRNARRYGQFRPPANNTVEPTFGTAVKKHGSKVVKKQKKAPPKPPIQPKPPPPPEVECWNPAGGDTYSFLKPGNEQTPSKVLRVVRIATWRTDTFLMSLKQLLSEVTMVQDVEMVTKDLDYGGEPRTDVHVIFRSEIVAEVGKEKMDEVLLLGRKLQVRFA